MNFETKIAQHVLIIGFVWPESKTTAAGLRILQLIDFFLKNNFKITFASSAEKSIYSDDLNALGIKESHIKLNDSEFNEFLKNLNPYIVLFDRFYTEEQFGWRVAEVCPNALRILDTEDLHFVRKVRQQAQKEGKEKIDLFSNLAKREIASIYRCDFSLIISEVEMQLLQEKFKMDVSLLFYLPFLCQKISHSKKESLPTFEERTNFIFLGNYKHQPNLDAILYLKETIWPILSKTLPKAELHGFGAYVSPQIKQLHNPKERFFIRGWVEDAFKEVQKAKVMLAPLRYGAGLKGKLIQAMQSGTPSITSTVGAEGIPGDYFWSGFIENNPDAFSEKAKELFTNKLIWQQAQTNGFTILEKRFTKENFANNLLKKIETTLLDLKKHREDNWIGSLLAHHSMQSTKYFSKWIEEKNK